MIIIITSVVTPFLACLRIVFIVVILEVGNTGGNACRGSPVGRISESLLQKGQTEIIIIWRLNSRMFGGKVFSDRTIHRYAN